MHATLQRFVEQVQAAANHGTPQADVIRGVEHACTELARAGTRLGDEYRHVPAEGHGRNLIFRDPERGFVVAAMVWPAGHKGCAHDHASWCVMSVLEGTVDVTNYLRTDDGSDPVRVELEETEAFQAAVGGVASVPPPPAHYHVVSNASDTELAITLHIYGVDLGRCQVVDLATCKAEEVQTAYHNEPAHQG